ncbi:hypothetical protein ACLESO_24495 [Pyxidicoccus sp. 3LG]
MRPGSEPVVTTCSALEGTGIEKLWDSVVSRVSQRAASGDLARRRQEQQVGWMWAMVQDGLRSALRAHPEVSALVPTLEADVREGRATPTSAALRVLGAFLPRMPA